MKMPASTKKTALGALLLPLSFSAVANYVEFGAELERYNSDYSGDNINMPYISFGANPVEGSPFRLEGHSSYAGRTDKNQTQNNRSRQELFVGYQWDFGNFTLAPSAGLRYESYGTGSTVHEYRIFPGVKYQLSDQTTVDIGGFIAPVRSRNSDRSTDPDVDRLVRYSDWKHELEYGLSHRLSNGNSFKVSFYNEYIKSDKAEREGVEDNRNEWQLRLRYSHRLNQQWGITPWARIGLSRKKEDAIGQKRDELRHRAGFDLSYRINNDWSASSRLYGQKENRENWDGSSREAKWRTYLKLSVRRNF